MRENIFFFLDEKMNFVVTLIAFVIILVILVIGIWTIVIGWKQRRAAKNMGDTALSGTNQAQMSSYGTQVLISGIVSLLSSIVLGVILISQVRK
jgi:hypothetical protein